VRIVTWNLNSPKVRLPRVLTPDLGARLTACDIARDFRKGSKPSEHAPLVADLA
jgi:exonuclease III